MIIGVKGGNKLQRELAKTVAEFVYNKYLSRFKTIMIDFKIVKNLAEKDGADGLCFATDYSKPRLFEIEIDSNLPLTCFIKTVIHEMIHVKQYVRGELVDRQRGRAKVTWKGKDHTKTSYSKQPWEREAYRLQESLYTEFMTKE